jgi:hypothetical protein
MNIKITAVHIVNDVALKGERYSGAQFEAKRSGLQGLCNHFAQIRPELAISAGTFGACASPMILVRSMTVLAHRRGFRMLPGGTPASFSAR